MEYGWQPISQEEGVHLLQEDLAWILKEIELAKLCEGGGRWGEWTERSEGVHDRNGH